MPKQVKYVGISNTLAAEIAEQPVGHRCPGVTEVASRFHVSRATAGHTIKRLAEMGLVEVVPGSGTFVAPRRTGQALVILPASGPSAGSTDAPLRAAGPDQALANAIVEHLGASGHDVSLVHSHHDGYVQGLSRNHPVLLVAVGEAAAATCALARARKGVHIVGVDVLRFDIEMDCIFTARLRGAYVATRVLLNAGLHDIYYMGTQGNAKQSRFSSIAMKAGFLAACEDADVRHADARIHLLARSGNWEGLVDSILGGHGRRPAVIAADANTAVGLRTAAEQYGMRVPKDLTILCAAGSAGCGATCLARNEALMATTAGHVAFHRLREPELPAQHIPVPPKVADGGTVPRRLLRALRDALGCARAERRGRRGRTGALAGRLADQ